MEPLENGAWWEGLGDVSLLRIMGLSLFFFPIFEVTWTALSPHACYNEVLLPKRPKGRRVGLPSVEEPFKILRPKKSFSLYMNVLSRTTE